MLSVVACVVLGASCGREARQATSMHHSRTSVLMLTLCTVRADHLGCYGYERNVTPNLDRLAAEGFRFASVLAQAPWTRSSVAAIITGMFPRSLNIEDPENKENYRRLHPDFTTLAEVLQAHGYHTIGITANPNTAAVFGMDQGFDEYDDPGVLWRDDYLQDGVWDSAFVAKRFLERLSARPADEKFFAHLVLIDAHVPRRHKLEPDEDDDFELPPRAKRTAADVYDLQLSFLDENIGELLRKLEDMGRAKDLLVVVNADHGEGLGDQSWMDRGHSRTVYNSTIWVPWILWHPGLGAHPGTRAGMVQQVDMLPTILELLEIDPGEAVRGLSALAGTSRASDVLGTGASAPLEHSVVRTQFLRADKGAFVTPEYKLILNFDHAEKMRYRLYPRRKVHYFPPPFELYRYRTDPLEREDLFGSEPDVAAELRRAYAEWQASYPPLVGAEELRMSLDEVHGELHALRALGYVGSD